MRIAKIEHTRAAGRVEALRIDRPVLAKRVARPLQAHGAQHHRTKRPRVEPLDSLVELRVDVHEEEGS
jgi:hypothetical protein